MNRHSSEQEICIHTCIGYKDIKTFILYTYTHELDKDKDIKDFKDVYNKYTHTLDIWILWIFRLFIINQLHDFPLKIVK